MPLNTYPEKIMSETHEGDDVDRMIRAGDALRLHAQDSARETGEEIAETARQVAYHTINGAQTVLGQAAETTNELMEQAFRNARFLSHPAAAFSVRANDLMQEWFDYGQRLTDLNRERLDLLQECSEPKDVVGIMADLWIEQARLSMECGARIAGLTSTLFRDAMDQIERGA
jgi:hypothetical protein